MKEQIEKTRLSLADIWQEANRENLENNILIKSKEEQKIFMDSFDTAFKKQFKGNDE